MPLFQVSNNACKVVNDDPSSSMISFTNSSKLNKRMFFINVFVLYINWLLYLYTTIFKSIIEFSKRVFLKINHGEITYLNVFNLCIYL